MTGAMVVISRPRLLTSHDTVVAFLRAAGCAIVRVRVRLSDASGSPSRRESGQRQHRRRALAGEVAITLLAARAGRLTWKTTITVSDGG